MTAKPHLAARLVGRVGALRIDVEVHTQGRLAIVGPNGAGKTTVLLMLLGVHPVERGRIAVGERVLFDAADETDAAVELRGLGYVPQDYALFPHLSVRQNVRFALEAAGGRASRDGKLSALLAELDLEALADRPVTTLSGGEKQRVALARALSVQPRALLLDEPLAALDVHARDEVRQFLARYLDALGIPALVVTHDAADARALGDHIAVLEAGTIAQTGTWAELCERPATPYVERFVR